MWAILTDSSYKYWLNVRRWTLSEHTLSMCECTYIPSVCTSIRTLGEKKAIFCSMFNSFFVPGSFHFYFISLLFIHFWFAAFFSLFSLVFFIHSAHISVAPPFTSFQSLSLSLSVFVSFTLAHFWYDVFITWKTLNYAFLLSRNDRELYILKLSLFWFCEYVFVSLSFVHVVVVGVFHFLLSHVPSGGRDILYKSYQQWLSRLFNSSTSLSVQHVRRKIKRPADFLSHSLSHTPGCFVASTPYSIT